MTAAGGAISLVVGTVLLRLTLTGTYQRYVREEMWPFLAVAGAVIIVLGLVTLTRALRRVTQVDEHEHHHDHGHVPIGWLLLAPIAALLLVAPPTLGSYGVDRVARVDIRAGARVFDSLPHGSQPVRMSLLEYGQRAFDHNGASFGGASVQLTGFVASSEKGQFRLARYQIACCAADAIPMVVRITGTSGDPPPRDQWVTVTGSYRRVADDVPELAATSVVEIEAPEDPYE